MTLAPEDGRLAEWGALAGGLAHEIKNPLSTMNISLQLLREDLQARSSVPTAQVLPRIELLVSEIRRLQKILNDFLRLARTPELALADRDPNAILEDILAFLSPELRRQNITLVTQLDRTVRSIRVDPDQLRQALINLVRNALEAMPGAGTLTLTSRRAGARFELDVIDTGQGIKQEILGRIFDGFFSTKPGGTGIGLAITRQIVGLHGGTIACQSEPGRGSKFTISLPIDGPGVAAS